MSNSVHLENDLYIVADPILGWRGRPNYTGYLPEYKNLPIQLDSDGWRALPNSPAQADMRLHLYGCSYVFGIGIMVDEIFATRVQQAFPWVIVRACAMHGFGTTQSFLSLQRHMRSTRPPDVVVFCMLDAHLKRNVASPDYVMNLQGRYWSQSREPLTIVRAGLGIDGKLFIKHIPLDRPALTRGDARDFAVDWYYNVQVTRKLIEHARDEAERGGAQFMVAILRRDYQPEAVNSLVQQLQTSGVRVEDISFKRGSSLDISPSNYHPNTLGHAKYAERLIPILQPLLTHRNSITS